MSETDPILQANLFVYDDGSEIDSYLDNTYHAPRVQIALDCIQNYIAQNNTVQLHGIELAAGTGHVAKKIAALGAHVVACDGSPSMLEQARRLGLETCLFDAAKPFPFPDGSMDFVYAGELIEHIFDARQFLSEVYRVLKPGGLCIMTTPNLATLKDRVRFIAGLSPRQISPFHPYLCLHIRPFTLGTLRQGLAEAGFRSIKIYSQCVEIPTPFKMLRIRWLAQLFPGIGGSLIAESYKPY